MLEGVSSEMSEPLTNEVKVVDTSYVSNPSLRLWRWLLIGAEEVRVSSPFLRSRQWLLVGVEEVRVSNPSLKPWQWLMVEAKEVV